MIIVMYGPPSAPQAPPRPRPTRTPPVLWVVTALVSVAIVAGTVLAIATSGGSKDASSTPGVTLGGGTGRPGVTTHSDDSGSGSSGGIVYHQGGVDPATLKVGDCYVAGRRTAPITEIAPCSNPKASYVVVTIVNPDKACPAAPQSRTNVYGYKSNGTETVQLCSGVNLVPGHCYVVNMNHAAAFVPTTCADARTHHGIDAIRDRAGVSEQLCPYPLEGFPNPLKRTITCVREYGS